MLTTWSRPPTVIVFVSSVLVGMAIALVEAGEQPIMPRFLNAALLGAALMVPVAIAPTALRAADHKTVTYHDKDHNDDHQWNSHEDKAYRAYAKENHRKYVTFTKLNENDQQAYWGWRHEHSDTLLKINIR